MLTYPLKSHRKEFPSPSESADLAELLGIHFGDGGINNPWQIVISLNSNADRDFALHVIYLFKKLFNYLPKLNKRPGQKTLTVVSTGSNLVDFFISKGAVKGNKIVNIHSIPDWIKNNPTFSLSFVRGLMDTDGCLFIQNKGAKKYLGLCFTNFSSPIIKFVAETLNKFDISPHLSDKDRRIYLYNSKAVQRYLEIFGTSNPRILNKFHEWRGRIVV